jgi:hypothetical protein
MSKKGSGECSAFGYTDLKDIENEMRQMVNHVR